ncbi:MAG: response regulator transcription factor [Coriobacteriia bacterium]|nr:response regulator transcription factor [Coriobacteriia bacterium]
MRLIIVDDDPFICDSLKTILSAQPDIEVLGVGYDGEEAVGLYRSHLPDILLTDIQMPGLSGLDAAAAILAEFPKARIVLLTTFSDDEYIVSALRMGAKGYLIKQDVATIAPALRLVMADQSVLGNEVIDRIDDLFYGEKPADPAASQASESPLAALSQREFEVAEQVAQGLDNREIAAKLFISEGTVRNMVSSILQKLGLKNRTQLAVLYYKGR